MNALLSEGTFRLYRQSHRRSFVFRLSLLGLITLLLAIGAPAASAGPILVPNADGGGSGSAMSGPQQTVSRLFNEVFTQQKGEVCTELMSAQALHVTPAGSYQGPEGFTAFAAIIWTAFPDATFVMENMSESAGQVAVRWSMTGTNLGPLDGHAASGQRVSLHGLALFTVDQDHITASWIEYDRHGLYDHITAAPLAPATCADSRELP